MSKVHVFDHPLIQHKLSIMRDKDTGCKEFRELLDEISMLMVYEVTRDLPTQEVEIETPICKTKAKHISGKKLAVVPILRAGLGMVDAISELIPSVRIGHIGLYRDEETLKPVEYYCKLPENIDQRTIVVVDPMLATGGSAIDAVSLIKERGGRKIKFMSIIAAPEGVEALMKAKVDLVSLDSAHGHNTGVIEKIKEIRAA